MRDKRQWFLIATAFTSLLFFLAQVVPFSISYQAFFIFFVISGVNIFFLFRKIAQKKKNALMATLLPMSFIIGLSMFLPLFSSGLLWRLLFSGFFAVVFYTLLLIENVFLVSAEFKSVPLYRAASTVSFILMLTTAFLLFDIVFSFRLSALLNGLIILPITFLLLSHFFWSIDPASNLNADIFKLSFVFSVIIAELAFALSFWPVGIGKGSLYLVSLFYVFGGLAQSWCRERLFKKTIWEFFWLGLGTFLALFLVTSWRGDFF